MPDSKTEKVALITGAASGLGAAVAAELAAGGWSVFAGWHRKRVPDAANVIPVALDVTSDAAIRSAVETVIAHAGRLDLLVNNVGATVNHLLPQTTEDQWDHILDLNLSGAFRCARAVMRQMFKQRSGHVINISSFAARSGPKGQAAYAAAKAAVIGFTQALAKEAGPRNVQANVILPGVMMTDMTSGLPETIITGFAEANALGRINDVREVARFIALLAEMKNISGQVFQLDSRIAPWT